MNDHPMNESDQPEDSVSSYAELERVLERALERIPDQALKAIFSSNERRILMTKEAHEIVFGKQEMVDVYDLPDPTVDYAPPPKKAQWKREREKFYRRK